MKLYETLAETIQEQIARGVMREGEKIPSVRRTSQQQNLSISTVIRAYLLLESRGVIESRPQSGYFVRAGQANVAPTSSTFPTSRSSHGDLAPATTPVPENLSSYALVLANLRMINCRNSVPLGSPYPDPSLFPEARISQLARGLYKRRERQELIGALPPGHPELIRQIARRHLETGLAIDAAEIIITEGATEAINLCLQAVARSGDAIAVEAPAYYAVLHAIARMGMRAVPIATDPETGIDIDALEDAIAAEGIVACIVMPNFQNPLGFVMPEQRKKMLVEMMRRHDLPLIENDVYGELHFDEQRPKSLKAFDRAGLVLYCSSFSKSLTAEPRIGWTIPGRYRERIEGLKFLNTVTTPSTPQVAIAEYLKNEGYDYHLRRLRKTYAQQVRIMSAAVLRFFPAGTRVSHPTGGYLLWVVMPAHIDVLELYARGHGDGISIAPGTMFSLDERFRNCLRLNCSFPWSPRLENAVQTLGGIATQLDAVRPIVAPPAAPPAAPPEISRAPAAAQGIGLTKVR